MNMEYLREIQSITEAIIHRETRNEAVARLHLAMKDRGFNEHTVADLIIMAYNIGKDKDF